MAIVAGISEAGLVRQSNEDAWVARGDLGLYLVADGMGGIRGGALASGLAVRRVQEVIGANKQRCLERAFREAHDAVRAFARLCPEYLGMGTTLAGVLVTEQGVSVASVGDSRVYEFRAGNLRRLTRDQSWVEEVGARLGLDAEALQRHPYRHVLMMSIGSDGDLRVESTTIQPDPGTLLLLSTDGLHGLVPDEGIATILAGERGLEDRCHSLIEAAIEAGGTDNVTVVLIEI
jgi:serine/threonine protein phosphatase PrpC